MAVPKSFLRKFLGKRKKSKSQPKGWSRRHAKKSKGLFRDLLGAVAGEALKGSGHIGKHIVKKISEDAMGSGGVPTNCASSGAISGLGKPGSDEPGVKKKSKNRAPLLTYKMFKRTKGLQA